MTEMKDSESTVTLTDTASKYGHAVQTSTWDIYYRWRKNDLDRKTYMQDSTTFKQLLLFTEAIPCRTYRRVWLDFLRSNEVTDKLRADPKFEREMRQIITSVHYDAVLYLAEHKKKRQQGLQKIKTFIMKK